MGLIAINEIQDGTCVLNTKLIENISYSEEEGCYVIETPNYSYSITADQFECLIKSEAVLDIRAAQSTGLYTREEIENLFHKAGFLEE